MRTHEVQSNPSPSSPHIPHPTLTNRPLGDVIRDGLAREFRMPHSDKTQIRIEPTPLNLKDLSGTCETDFEA